LTADATIKKIERRVACVRWCRVVFARARASGGELAIGLSVEFFF
tara:strand:+ start:196 stop:330 length:135 start_codon:yes stop_codon:yes gene_type:complete